MRVTTPKELLNDNQIGQALRVNTTLRGILISGLKSASSSFLDAISSNSNLEYFQLTDLVVPVDYISKMASNFRKVADFNVKNMEDITEEMINKKTQYCLFEHYF